MKIDPAFLKAAANRSLERGPVVYRLSLRPITLGHLFILQEIGSPLLYDVEDERGKRYVDELEFLLAAFIFSLKPESARRALDSWWIGLFLKVWSWMACRQLDLEANQEALTQWVIECLSMPKNSVPMDKGTEVRELSAPQNYRLLAILMNVFHMSEAEAMNTPLKHANCLYLAWAEWEGRVNLAESPLLDLVEWAKEQDSLLYDSQGNRLPTYEQEMNRRRNLGMNRN